MLTINGTIKVKSAKVFERAGEYFLSLQDTDWNNFMTYRSLKGSEAFGLLIQVQTAIVSPLEIDLNMDLHR